MVDMTQRREAGDEGLGFERLAYEMNRVAIFAIQESEGRLPVAFTRCADNDYAHEDAPATAAQLAACLPSAIIGDGAKLAYGYEGGRVEMSFETVDSPSVVSIVRSGISSGHGKGPSANTLRAICAGVTMDSIDAQSKGRSAIGIDEVFWRLKNEQPVRPALVLTPAAQARTRPGP